MIRILVGDCRTVLAGLPDQSVQCCVTSPPYFGLRDYGIAEQIGLEATPEAFVAELVAVFREVRRVLRDDGTLWLNLGDSYSGSGRGGNPEAGTKQGTNAGSQTVGVLYGLGPEDRAAERARMKAQNEALRAGGLKPKDLIGIPWRVAFALQADGWYLRQDIIWSKPNPMPESVQDRCTKAHEYLFLLSKSPTYHCDMAAIAEPAIYSGLAGQDASGYKDAANFDGKHGRFAGNVRPAKGQAAYEAGDERQRTKAALLANAEKAREEGGYQTRNKRSVWTVATQPFKEAHFATFPPALIEPCILAGCPVGGTVLDPFGGAGTTGLVADRLQRSAILIELNPAYAEMARARVTGDAPLFADVA